MANDGFCSPLSEYAKLFLQLFADRRVDRAEQFVHQHKLRVCRRGARQRPRAAAGLWKLSAEGLALRIRPTTSSNSPALALLLVAQLHDIHLLGYWNRYRAKSCITIPVTG